MSNHYKAARTRAPWVVGPWPELKEGILAALFRLGANGMTRILKALAPWVATSEWHKVDGAVEREIADFLARHQASWYRDPEPTAAFAAGICVPPPRNRPRVVEEKRISTARRCEGRGTLRVNL